MAILINNISGFNTQRSFEPRELKLVPGQPEALSHRPKQAPGIIPIAATGNRNSPEPQNNVAESELETNIERQKQASQDYQIITYSFHEKAHEKINSKTTQITAPQILHYKIQHYTQSLDNLLTHR